MSVLSLEEGVTTVMITGSFQMPEAFTSITLLRENNAETI